MKIWIWNEEAGDSGEWELLAECPDKSVLFVYRSLEIAQPWLKYHRGEKPTDKPTN